MSQQSVVASIIADLKKGKPFEYSEDVYGAGRVKIVFAYDFAAELFVKKTTEQDVSGNESVFSEQLSHTQCLEEIKRCLLSK